MTVDLIQKKRLRFQKTEISILGDKSGDKN